MSNFGIIMTDENCLVSDFHSTEAETIEVFERETGMDWDELQNNHKVQDFTDDEVADSVNWPTL